MLQPEIPSDFLMFDYSSSHLLNLEHFDRIPLVHNVLFTFGHNMQIYFPSFFQIEMGKKIAPLSLEKKKTNNNFVGCCAAMHSREQPDGRDSLSLYRCQGL